MDWNQHLFPENEKPLDRLVNGYSYTSIFHTIGFVGDSLSSGEFETRDAEGNAGYHDMYWYSWGQYIARKNGITAYNFSKGGMSADCYVQHFGDMEGKWTPGLWDPKNACQAYVIALGVNDLHNMHQPLGSIEDIHPEDWTKNAPTFLGYYGAIISRYKQISPDAKFFLVTFPNDELLENNKEVGMKAIESLYALAKLFKNCYVIDLYQYGPVYDQKFRDNFYLFGHMSPAGYILTAQLIDSYIDYIIRHNPDDFKNIGFANTGIPY